MRLTTIFVLLVLLCSYVYSMNPPSDINVEVDGSKFGIFWDISDYQCGDDVAHNDASGNEGHLYWHTRDFLGSVGSSSQEFDTAIAIRFEPQHLTPFNGSVIDYVGFHAVETNCDYILEVYQGGSFNNPGNILLSSQTITGSSLTTGEYNYIQLYAPATLDAALDLWIVMHIDSHAPGLYPAPVDDAFFYETISGLSDLIQDTNGNFVGFSSLYPNECGNWMMSAYVTNQFSIDQPATNYQPAVSLSLPASAIEVRESRFPVAVELENPHARLEFIQGYKIYREGTLVEEIRHTNHMKKRFYYGTEEPGSYVYNISCIYVDCYSGSEYESLLSDDIVINVADSLEHLPPRDVQCKVLYGNEPVLTWLHPGAPLGENRLCLPGDLELASESYGMDGFKKFEYGVRFEASDLINYSAHSISNVRMFAADSLATYKLRIYEGGSVVYSAADSMYIFDEGVLIYEKPIINPEIGEFNIIDIDPGIMIYANTEYWFTIETTQWGDNIESVANSGNPGEIHNMKGNLIKLHEWSTTYEEGDNIAYEYDNYLQIYVSQTPVRTVNNDYVPERTADNERISDWTGWKVNWDINTNNPVEYTINRNSFKLEMDGVGPGIHEYSVSAVYGNDVTCDSPAESLDLYLCEPDSVSIQLVNDHTIRFYWAEPYGIDYNRALSQYRLYKGDIRDYTQMELIDSTYAYSYTYDSFAYGQYYCITAVYNNCTTGETWESGYYIDFTAKDEDDLNFETGISSVYPNPFNPETNIRFALKQDSDVEISVYNIKGQKVKTLRREHFAKGEHVLTWKGKDNHNSDVGSGVYFIRLKTGSSEQTRKAVLLK